MTNQNGAPATLKQAVENAIDDFCRLKGTTRPPLVVSLSEEVAAAAPDIRPFMSSRVNVKTLVDYQTKSEFNRVYPIDDEGKFTSIVNGNKVQLIINRPGMTDKAPKEGKSSKGNVRSF